MGFEVLRLSPNFLQKCITSKSHFKNYVYFFALQLCEQAANNTA